MIKNFSRSFRRHHLSRLKKKRGSFWGRNIRFDPRALGMAANTACLCSCFCCGNPRKMFHQKTLAEKTFAVIEREGYALTKCAEILPVQGGDE